MRITSMNVAAGLLALFGVVCLAVVLTPGTAYSSPTAATVQRAAVLQHIAGSNEAKQTGSGSDAAQKLAQGTQASLSGFEQRAQAERGATEAAAVIDTVPRVKVDVYMEMMCPDTARFFVHDLGPERFPDQLWDIVELHLVPWVRCVTAHRHHSVPLHTLHACTSVLCLCRSHVPCTLHVLALRGVPARTLAHALGPRRRRRCCGHRQRACRLCAGAPISAGTNHRHKVHTAAAPVPRALARRRARCT